MKVEFKTTLTIDVNLRYMAFSLLNEENVSCFQMFLLDYMENSENIRNANLYDNWYEIKTSVYNNLFVYCAENDLEDILEKLKKLKDF